MERVSFDYNWFYILNDEFLQDFIKSIQALLDFSRHWSKQPVSYP